MELERFGIPKHEITAYNKKHIFTEEDLVRWFPRKYRNYTQFTDILDAKDGDFIAVRAKLMRIDTKGSPANPFVSLGFVSRGRQTRSGENAWFNISLFAHKACNYLANVVYPPFLNKDVIVYGKLTIDDTYGGYYITPEKNVGNGNGIEYETAFKKKIYPIYPKIGGVKEAAFASMLNHLIPMQHEVLEAPIRENYGLMPYTEALSKVHNPKTEEELRAAKQQFAFYDLLHFCSELKEMNSKLPSKSEIKFSKLDLTKKFMTQIIPYSLTKLKDRSKLIDKETGILSGGQADAISYMLWKIAKGKRLNALVEGDVGCGKTLVAICMMIAAHENGYQTVLMAPKTVLAGQHYAEIKEYADKLGIGCVYLRSGSSAAEKKERKESLKLIKEGKASLIVGTHSCISSDVVYNNLGLVVLDEEQQFGVEQKLELFNKALPGCHSIEMSATPIPRSLTMSIYTNKDIVRIVVKPSGRLPIKTDFRSNESIAYAVVENELKKGHQAYVVCPAIDDNEEVNLTGVDTVGANYKAALEPKGYKIGVINGRMKTNEFNQIINDFKENRLQVLVSTTVIEVGVNVPNATIIIIHQAERFGLSQLHQLRGRVGRKNLQSYCLLLTADTNNERVHAMKNLSNGFDIAEADYKMRGPGNVIGTEQSGDSKFINEAIEMPELFNKAKAAVLEFNDENRYGFFLNYMYDEHERLDEEYKGKKKNGSN